VLPAFAALDIAVGFGRLEARRAGAGDAGDAVDVGNAGRTGGPRGPGLPPALLAFFAIHLALVTPVGLAMFLVPETVGDLWPWPLTTVNVRLVGSIFIGSIPVSALAIGARSWRDVRPTLAAYGVFATLALAAVGVHFALFDPGLLRTWLFIALYAFVAAGSIIALLAEWARRRTA
jgi:hypothetical protein